MTNSKKDASTAMYGNKERATAKKVPSSRSDLTPFYDCAASRCSLVIYRLILLKGNDMHG